MKLKIDSNSVKYIKENLKKEKAPYARIFVAGGGCCKRLLIVPIKSQITGDIAYEQEGLKLYIEKELVENSSSIDISYDEKKGLIIEFNN